MKIIKILSNNQCKTIVDSDDRTWKSTRISDNRIIEIASSGSSVYSDLLDTSAYLQTMENYLEAPMGIIVI